MSVDPVLCIGSGTCVHIAPETFFLDDDGVADVSEPIRGRPGSAPARGTVVPGVGDLRRDRRLSRQEESRRGDHLGATGGAAARAAVRPAHRGRRRPCPRVARGARAVLRHAVAGRAGEHLGRARDLPRHPVVLARRVRRQLPGEVPHGARGRAHGALARADARGARRDPRGPRDPLPRPPAQAAGADADRVRRRARAGLQRVARRPVGVRRARAARVHHRLQPRPRRGRPRDRALRPAPGDRRRLPAPARASTRCGATAATTRSTPPPRPRTCRSCCTA